MVIKLEHAVPDRRSACAGRSAPVVAAWPDRRSRAVETAGGRQTTWPSRSCTLSISVGTTSSPARVDRGIGAGLAQHRGVHRAQRGRQHPRHRCPPCGRRWRCRATASMPTCCATRSVTRFSDFSSATRSGVGPPKCQLVVARPPACHPAVIDHDRRIEEASGSAKSPFSSAVR